MWQIAFFVLSVTTAVIKREKSTQNNSEVIMPALIKKQFEVKG